MAVVACLGVPDISIAAEGGAPDTPYWRGQSGYEFQVGHFEPGKLTVGLCSVFKAPEGYATGYARLRESVVFVCSRGFGALEALYGVVQSWVSGAISVPRRSVWAAVRNAWRWQVAFGENGCRFSLSRLEGRLFMAYQQSQERDCIESLRRNNAIPGAQVP